MEAVIWDCETTLDGRHSKSYVGRNSYGFVRCGLILNFAVWSVHAIWCRWW